MCSHDVSPLEQSILQKKSNDFPKKKILTKLEWFKPFLTKKRRTELYIDMLIWKEKNVKFNKKCMIQSQQGNIEKYQLKLVVKMINYGK